MADIEKRVTLNESQDGVGGKLSLDENVVATIAGVASRGVEGVHSIGKSSLLAFGDKTTRGIAAEVGDKQAALDLEIVVEYGMDIREVATELRRRITEAIEKMAGREVVEVNIHVVDIKLPGEVEDKTSPRVK